MISFKSFGCSYLICDSPKLCEPDMRDICIHVMEAGKLKQRHEDVTLPLSSESHEEFLWRGNNYSLIIQRRSTFKVSLISFAYLQNKALLAVTFFEKHSLSV